jgi:uncharacterized protein (DUF885 family)
MRRGARKVSWGFGLLLIALGVFLVPTIWLKPWAIDHFYTRLFLRFASRHPMLLSQLGMFDGTPFDFYSAKLDDLSPSFQRKEARYAEDELATLRSYDRSKMTPSGKLSYDVLEWFLVNQQQDNQFLFYDYPVNQLFGVQSELPSFMLNTHPLKNPAEARAYVSRVSQFGTAIDQTIEGLELRESKGIVPPRFVIREVLDQMKGFVGKPPRENPLYAHFASAADSIRSLRPDQRVALDRDLEKQIRDTVYPAYQRLITYEQHLESVATDDDGVWKLPNGDAYYDQCLRDNTTTDMPADSIHALGLSEVARIQTEMKRILAEQGERTTDLGAEMNRLLAEPRFHFPPGDSGRAIIMADYQAILDDANRRVGALFDIRPKTAVKVERVPAFKEATSPGAYYQPGSLSGSRPGTFFVNLRDPQENKRPDMRTLAYHEGIPGHHFQITIQQQLKGVPFFRRILPFTAYAEGWGLYAERLAYESGFHQDAYDSLGGLQAELFRAVRLVVDTGIHRKHWTRQQAIDYMVANTGMEPSKVVTEIERYIVNPGQACAYKVGQLKILELRERARQRLGSRFDIRRFHDVVLENGSLPLGLLERVVDDWVAQELKHPSAGDRG